MDQGVADLRPGRDPIEGQFAGPFARVLIASVLGLAAVQGIAAAQPAEPRIAGAGSRRSSTVENCG
jgi:hypothetical protein